MSQDRGIDWLLRNLNVNRNRILASAKTEEEKRSLCQQLTLELIGPAQRGSMSARQKLLELHLPLTIGVIRQFGYALRKNGSINYDDYLQEGVLGLNHAIDKFDPSKGCELSTYAYPWIRQAIVRYIQNTSRTVRIPCHLYEKRATAYKAIKQLYREGKKVTDEAIALKSEELSKRPASVKDLQRIGEAFQSTLTLDAKATTEGEVRLHEIIPADQPSVYDTIDTWLVEGKIQEILEGNGRQQEIIFMFFGLGEHQGRCYTIGEIAEVLGTSKNNINNLKLVALQKIRRYFQRAPQGEGDLAA